MRVARFVRTITARGARWRYPRGVPAVTTASELRVSDLMSSPVFSLGPTQSLTLADSLMQMARIRHIPVVDGGKLVGLVTHRDLLAASLSALTPLSEDERSTLQLAVPVSRVMQTEVWTIQPKALAVTAARLMRDHRFGCLPVVEDDKLVGIITEHDLLAVVADALDLGPPPAAWTVERAMTPAPVALPPSATVAAARAAMDAYNIRHVPVTDLSGKPVGLVTDRDLRVVEAVFPEPAGARALHAIKVIGAEPPHAVAPSAPLDEVLVEMANRRVDAALVLEGARLVGILTSVDACRLLGQRLAAARRRPA